MDDASHAERERLALRAGTARRESARLRAEARALVSTCVESRLERLDRVTAAVTRARAARDAAPA